MANPSASQYVATKKTGMDDEAYRHHMTQVSAPMTKDLMVKGDPEYKRRLMGDQEKFADTKKSMTSIGWIEQFLDSGIMVEGLEDPAKSQAALQTTALITGWFLSGAMMAFSGVAVPVFLDTTKTAAQMYTQWARM